MNVYFIRHGESMGNYTNTIQGTMDFPLSPLGKKQAETVGAYLASKTLHYVYSSPLKRAYDTAVAICNKQKEPVDVTRWADVKEVYLGPLQGKTRKEIYAAYPSTKKTSILTSNIAGTEPVAEITKRCARLFSHLTDHHEEGEQIAIVSHGGFISIFLMYAMLKEKWHTYARPFQIDNTGMTHVQWKANGEVLFHTVNETGHLQEDKRSKGPSTML